MVSCDFINAIAPYLSEDVIVYFSVLGFAIAFAICSIVSFGYGFAKFVFETLVRLIKGVIQNDR